MTHTATRRSRPTYTALEAYLTEIDATPLLTAEQERELAGRIAAGDLAARDQMVRANLRLVVNLARRYAGRGLALEDLIAEGNMGLLRAAEGFDASAGTRFGTYAAYWIKQSMRRALTRDGNTVRLPQYVTTLVAKWRQAVSLLQRELGRNPEEAEVARRLGLNERKVRIVRKAMKAYASGYQAEDADGTAAVEQAADPTGGCPGDRLAGAEEMRKALASIDRLGEREAAVLRMRFGLDGQPPVTLQEAGERLGYTRERVRQIERDALARLREHLAA